MIQKLIFKLSINIIKTAGCVKQPAVFYIIGRDAVRISAMNIASYLF